MQYRLIGMYFLQRNIKALHQIEQKLYELTTTQNDSFYSFGSIFVPALWRHNCMMS